MTFKELITGQFPVSRRKLVFGSIPFVIIAVTGLSLGVLEFFKKPSLFLVIPFLYCVLLVAYLIITMTQEVKREIKNKNY
jgi:cytochrome b subunit of formate dehydrogenase